MNESRRSRRGSAGERGADTRAALLAAGLDAFARRGYDGASIREITSHAGANLGAVTYHFGSKRELYGAVLQAELSPLAEAIQRVVDDGGSALDRICGVVEAYFAHLAEHPALPRLMLQEIAAGKEPPEPVHRMIRFVAGQLAALQREGEQDGSVRSGHPVLTALSIVSQPLFMNLVAPLAQRVLGSDLRAPDTRKTMVAHATAFVRAGLTPREEAPS